MPFSKKLARYARRTLLALAALATLVAGFVALENWRGERAWKTLAAEYAARGDPLDVFPAPSTLPPERNFMETPALARLLCPSQDQAEEVKTFLQYEPVQTAKMFEWRNGKSFDMARFLDGQKRSTAREFSFAGMSVTIPPMPPLLPADAPRDAVAVLKQLAPLRPWMGELCTAIANRPDSQWVRPTPLDRAAPQTAPIPSFRIVRAFMTGLAAQACAELRQGRSAEAADGTIAALRLSRGLSSHPDSLLVEAMIGVVSVNIALQPVWEGCSGHQWSEAQLARLQSELSAMSVYRGVERALRSERTYFVLVLDALPLPELLGLHSSEPNHIWSRRWLCWVPHGWVQQNKVSDAKLMKEGIDAAAAQSTPEFLGRLAARDVRLGQDEARSATPYTFLASMALPAFDKVVQKAAVGETQVRLALVACALERHRLVHGEYPETLRALVPSYLAAIPVDMIDGQPLRYRRLADGSFQLYSIGLDGKDDGGTPSHWGDSDGAKSGDWCWVQLRE